MADRVLKLVESTVRVSVAGGPLVAALAAAGALPFAERAEAAEAGAVAAQAGSESARDLSQQFAADAAQVSGVNVPIYASVATAEGSTIVAGVKSIRAQFRSPTYSDLATLKGGAEYVRASLADLTDYPTASYFRSTDRFMPDGTTDATNGGYWLLNETAPKPAHMGAVGDGATDDTAAFQALIDYAEAKGLSQLRLAGSYDLSAGSLTGGSGLTWLLEPGTSVTPGKLPGRVVPLAPPTWAQPQKVWSSRSRKDAYLVTFTLASALAAGATSGTLTASAPGICSTDRLLWSPRLWTGALADIDIRSHGIDPNGRNSVATRLKNDGGTSIPSGDRSFVVEAVKNDSLRQVFCLSRPQDGDRFLAGVDVEGVKSAAILRSDVGGEDFHSIYAVAASGIRNFVEITANTSSGTLNTKMLALLADPTTAANLVLKTTDAFSTGESPETEYLSLTLSGTNAETVLFDGDVEGGQGNGTGTSIVILGSFRPGGDPATAIRGTDGGDTFAAPFEILPGTGYDSCWGVKWMSGVGADGVWRTFLHSETDPSLRPAIAESTQGGAAGTFSLLCTVGDPGDAWQGIIKLADGTILAGLESADGGVWELAVGASVMTKVFAVADVVTSDVKPRCFVEVNGDVYMGSQDGSHIWRGQRVNGLWRWVCEYRIAQLFGVICMAASSNVLLTGGGQGLLTGKPDKAEIYRQIRLPHRHQYG